MENVVIALSVVMFFLVILYIYVANDTSLQGEQLGLLETQLQAAKKQNLLLKEQLYTLESYTNISTKSAGMGFIPAKQVIFLH